MNKIYDEDTYLCFEFMKIMLCENDLRKLLRVVEDSNSLVRF